MDNCLWIDGEREFPRYFGSARVGRVEALERDTATGVAWTAVVVPLPNAPALQRTKERSPRELPNQLHRGLPRIRPRKLTKFSGRPRTVTPRFSVTPSSGGGGAVRCIFTVFGLEDDRTHFGWTTEAVDGGAGRYGLMTATHAGVDTRGHRGHLVVALSE